jgi:protein-disulfide isomerase
VRFTRFSLPRRGSPLPLCTMPALAAVVLFALTASPGAADEASGSAESEAMSATEQRSEMEKLLEIARQRQAPVKGMDEVVELASRPSVGDPDAAVILIEFSDFQCPHCRKHTLETFPLLLTEWVETGLVYYVFRDYPVDTAHPFARPAAEAGRCAAEQGRHVEFRRHLYENSKVLQPVFLPEHAKAVGLDVDDFERCIESERYAAEVEADLTLARDLGIRGTPSFLVGVRGADPSTIRVLRRIDGARDPSVFAEVLTATVRETSLGLVE